MSLVEIVSSIVLGVCVVICLAAVGQFPYVIPVIDSPLSDELLVS